MPHAMLAQWRERQAEHPVSHRTPNLGEHLVRRWELALPRFTWTHSLLGSAAGTTTKGRAFIGGGLDAGSVLAHLQLAMHQQRSLACIASHGGDESGVSALHCFMSAMNYIYFKIINVL